MLAKGGQTVRVAAAAEFGMAFDGLIWASATPIRLSCGCGRRSGLAGPGFQVPHCK